MRRVDLGCPILLLTISVAVLAEEAKPATPPPPIEHLAHLEGPKLLKLFVEWFPKFDRSMTLDEHKNFKTALLEEFTRRSDSVYFLYRHSPARIDLENTDDATLALLLFAADWDRRNPAAMERIAAGAFKRGGQVRHLALLRHKFRDLKWMSDEELAQILALSRGKRPGWHALGDTRESALLEIARRGGKRWESVLKDEFDELNRLNTQADWPLPTLETLTALRRVQGRTDPMQVEISGPKTIEAVFPNLPSLDVALVNRDGDGASINFTEGGDYRSGRQARWRIEVRDQFERLIPHRRIIFGMGGGISTHGTLKPGEKWETTLSMPSYVPALPPGEYTMRVLYHDHVTIADREDANGYVTHGSIPMKLKISPLILPNDPANLQGARDLLTAIDEKQRLKIVAGTYGDWAEKFVPPESAQAKLLSLGLKSLPVLLESLANEDLSPQRRALLLSLLFSVTGQHDPREVHGTLPAYDAEDGPWAVVTSTGGGFGIHSSTSVNFGTINEADQKEFAKRWAPWKHYVQIAPAKD